MKMRKLFKKGFTLVELVVVIAVIAIFAAVSVGAYFGVTDSANSSNATAALKQVKDMWLLYSVEEYDELTDKSNDNVGTDFCLRYLPSQGYDQVYTNYKVVNIDYEKGSTSTAYNLNSSLKEGLLIKIETEYASWLLIDGNKIIETSEIYKNAVDFENSIINSKYVVADEANKVSFDDFEIGTVLADGKERRGFKYNLFTINPINSSNPSETFLVKTNQSLSDYDNHKYQLKEYSSVNNYETQLKIKYWFRFYDENGEEYLPNTIIEESDTDVALNSDALDGFELSDYQFVTNKVVLEQRFAKDLTEDLNINNYPIVIVESGDITFYDSFENVNEFFAGDKSGQILIGKNVVLDENFTIPANYTLVIEDNISRYGSSYSSYVPKAINQIDDQNTNTSKTFQFLNSDLVKVKTDVNGNYVREFLGLPDFSSLNSCSLVIPEGKILTVNGKINVEGIFSKTAGGLQTGLDTFGFIENNGSIVLEASSNLKSLGRIHGSGEIISKKDSKVYDLFKVTSYTGGTNTIDSYFGSNFSDKYNAYLNATGYKKYLALAAAGTSALGLINNFENGKTAGVFPFIDYRFDNITCDTIFESGSSYTSLMALKLMNDFKTPLHIISNNNNGLFTIHENSKLKKSFNKDTGNLIFNLIEGSMSFSNLTVNLNINIKDIINTDLVIQSVDFNLPICNIDLIVSNNTNINIRDINSKGLRVELYPTSSLKNYGNINIYDSSKLALFTPNNNDYESIKTFAQFDLDKRIFNYLKANFLFENYNFVNEGFINVYGTGSGFYVLNNEALKGLGTVQYHVSTNANTYNFVIPSLDNKDGNNKSVKSITTNLYQ